MTKNGLCLGVILVAASTVGFAMDRDADKGNEIFDEQCAQCHHAYKDEKKAGPTLKWLFSKDKLDSNGKPVNDANVLEKIEKGGKGMPAFKGSFTSEDQSDLLAYLKTL